jgi:hypothetical protein
MTWGRILRFLATVVVAAVYGGAVAYMVTGVARRYRMEQSRLAAAKPSRGASLARALPWLATMRRARLRSGPRRPAARVLPRPAARPRR